MARIGFYRGMSHCLPKKQKNLLLSFATALKIFFRFKKNLKKWTRKKKNEFQKNTSSKIHGVNNSWSKWCLVKIMVGENNGWSKSYLVQVLFSTDYSLGQIMAGADYPQVRLYPGQILPQVKLYLGQILPQVRLYPGQILSQFTLNLRVGIY